ncbi:Hypothetical protein, predicted lipoprotein [Mycoplasmopsis agalactiae 14628]|uniref:Endonuclease/exonuclease/phosphatase domain-containing protein n=1 Tax=Mycoplasmopsis agalactiae 14628 TaxID=1110504 RepID=I5D6L7_MYCAA|nr:endonuclease/exonuclease/phosphatase family protein [Mycoplasmopsis agalactiae]EIN15326.1 Hypothetical protein, predicted lipoprotein [Mycoplasmopsis agalactiae 14628]
MKKVKWIYTSAGILTAAGSLSTTVSCFIPFGDSDSSKITISNSANAPINKAQNDNISGGLNVAKSGAYKDINIGFWNVLNYSPSSLSSAYFKTQALASVIAQQHYDLVGLVELKGSNNNHLDELIKLLNEQSKKISSLDRWAYRVSDKYLSNPSYKKHDESEFAGFLYKTNKLEPIQFNDGSIGKIYKKDNPEFNETPFGGGVKHYSRPPFGMKFRILNNKLKNNDFTYIIDHFDSPGVKKSTAEVASRGAGSSELNEAHNLQYVFDYFNGIDGENEDLFFAGDTNIKASNHNEAFSWIAKNPIYKNVFEPTSANNTSLSASLNKYANSYDKIIHRSNLKYNNPKIFKLYDFVNNVFLYKNINSLNDWMNFVKSSSRKTYGSDYGYIRSGISDHSPVGYTVLFE